MTSRGKILWQELFTQDATKAKVFYTELFNWSTKSMEMNGQQPYEMFCLGDRPIAGILPSTADSITPQWLAYVGVDNLDQALTQIKNQGGQIIVPEQKIPGMGRWVVAKDAQGALFSPFQMEKYNPQDGRQMPAPVDAFCWHELMTHNRDQALQHYGELFGWQKGEAFEMSPNCIYQMYNQTGQQQPMGGMMQITPDMNMPHSFWMEYVHVKNVKETIQRAVDLGGSKIFDVMKTPDGGQVAGFADNQGTMLAVWNGA